MVLERPPATESGKPIGLEAEFRKLLIESLHGQQYDVFIRAVTKVLSSEIAKFTYAQIIDGLPLADVANDTSGGGLPNMHPLHTMHEKLCPGVVQKVQEFLANFNPNVLQIDSRLLYAYQTASPSTRAFKTLLIEIVAVAIHQIAVLLFKLDTSLHKDDGVTSWALPKDDIVFWTFFPDGPPPTIFRHEWYGDYDQYPEGVADMVGYWAEARILGGVVLFDRREPGTDTEIQLDAVYFHSDRNEVTYRIYQLLDSQKQQLLDFLLHDETASSPLPILGDKNNIRRVDPEEPIERTGIYRDIWEPKPLSLDAPDMRTKDVYDDLEYPTVKDFQQAQERALARKRELYNLLED